MAKIKFLVVDDQKSIRGLLRSIIEGMGGEVIDEAEDGEQAVTKFQQHSPHITLMDINMPKKDGVAALKDIMFQNDKALVIMLTSQNSMGVVQDCLEAGARNFLLKDNPPEELLEKIKTTWSEYKRELKAAT